MQLDAWEKSRMYIRETGMLKGIRSLIVGVSGGSDSVFLLCSLLDAVRTEKISIRVVHVHHGIRGEEADRDAAFVEELCRQRGVPCLVVRRNIPQEARERHMTLEEAGRAARREIFEHEVREMGDGTAIALAHQKDDVAETLLLNLVRGTGLKGLGSVAPVRGLYLRPLLCVTKREIEAALEERGISWVVDSTNDEDDAARNRIRHHVVPYLVEELNAQAVSHMADTARIAREAEEFIEEEAEKRREKYVHAYDGGCIVSDSVTDESSLMQEELIRLAVGDQLASLKDFSSLHVRLILGLFRKPTGKRLDLPRGLVAMKVHGGIFLFNNQENY